MKLRGITLCANPAVVTAPGIPHTVLLAWSWANTLPPCSRMRRAPIIPSVPMPVSTTASTPEP